MTKKRNSVTLLSLIKIKLKKLKEEYFMAIKKKNLPTGISWREDRNKYMGRVTYKKQSYVLYDVSWQRLNIRLQELRVELNKGTYFQETNVTLNEWFSTWMKKYKKHTLKVSTYNTYDKFYKYYVEDKIGNIKLNKISTNDVQIILNDLSNEALSKATIVFTKTLLNGCFKKAMQLKMISTNPVVYAEVPKCKEKVEKKVFTKEEQKKFLEYAKKSYLGEMFQLILWTGLRIGEVRGLRYCDIDWEKRILTVNHTLVWTSENGYFLDSPKTKSSKRNIPLLTKAFEMLQKIKKIAQTQGVWSNEAYIFCLPDGTEISRSRVSKELSRIENQMKKDGIDKHTTAHTLRHCFATRAIEGGMKPQVLKGVLGHTNLSMTMDLYSHVLDAEQIKEMLVAENSITVDDMAM